MQAAVLNKIDSNRSLVVSVHAEQRYAINKLESHRNKLGPIQSQTYYVGKTNKRTGTVINHNEPVFPYGDSGIED